MYVYDIRSTIKGLEGEVHEIDGKSQEALIVRREVIER